LAKLPEFQLLISELRTKLEDEMPQFVRILPVQFTGGIWRNKTDHLRSSTYRERLAQIYVHETVYPYLAGYVYLVCDGHNTRVQLPEPELHFTGPLLSLYDHMLNSITDVTSVILLTEDVAKKV
jgi:hypothetical protein